MIVTQGWTGEGHGALVYKLEFPEATPSNNTIKGMNRFVYQALRQRWQGMVLDAIRNHIPATPIDRSALIVVRHSSSYLDWDNALGGLKPLIDCLVCASARNPSGLGLVADDNPTNMPIAPYVHQLKCKRGEERTELFIYKMDESSGTGADLPAWCADDSNLVYSLEIPFESPSNNTIKAMSSKNYRALRKLWQYRVVTALGGRRSKPTLGKAAILVTRHCSGQLDWDNALGGLKPLLDCLVLSSRKNPSGLGLVEDDNPKFMPYPPFMQQFKSKRDAARTELRIFRL